MRIEVATAAADAEAAIIGAMLIDSHCIGDVLVAIREQDFLSESRRAVFAAIRDLFTAGTPVDPVTVLARVGQECREMLLECMNVTPTAVNVLEYCRILREQTKLYRLHVAAENIAAATTLSEARAVMAEAMTELEDQPDMRIATMGELFAELFQKLKGPVPEYLHWGMPMLDSALTVDRGKFIVLGARPSTGKTALALQLAGNIAEKYRVGFFSLETNEELVCQRAAAQSLSVRLPEIQRHRVSDEQLAFMAKQTVGMSAFLSNLTVIRRSSLTVSELRSIALAKKMDVVFVDYVQLMTPANPKLIEATPAMRSISMELRAMAQRTGITIVALAQLRRYDPTSKKNLPTMAELKESGQLEQDADVVLLLSHKDAKQHSGPRVLQIAKNKEGVAGICCTIDFDGKKQLFSYEEEPEEEERPRPVFKPLRKAQMEIPFEKEES